MASQLGATHVSLHEYDPDDMEDKCAIYDRQDRFMLMDCGEGTHCQLVRFFGARGSADVLANLVGVFISHLHADHHIGLIGLLQARQRAQQSLGRPITPITLIAPAQVDMLWDKLWIPDNLSIPRRWRWYVESVLFNMLPFFTQKLLPVALSVIDR